MRKVLMPAFLLSIIVLGCNVKKVKEAIISEKEDSINIPFYWESANLYFLLTDRFNNGDSSNDINFNRTSAAGKLRGFEGGDIKGITQKIKEGYFSDLGVNAIWLSPIVEQIHGATDEGTGLTYGFHGYWTKDWTSIDPNYGTKENLHELVETAHSHGIRIVLDAVINHTGPVTNEDSVWNSDWVRTTPKCGFNNYKNTVTCTLVDNLPDIKTESNEDVELPMQLVEKWKAEGRYEKEVEELNTFFEETGYPRAPRFYIIKWLTDYITEFGIDGYRADTVKHTEEYVWEEFKKVCDATFTKWKKSNPEKVLDNNPFYLVGEVYNYGITGQKFFDFGDKKVNYFDNKFTSQINFEFKWNARQQSYEEMFSRYSSILNSNLKGFGVLNYLSSHDDGTPFDPARKKPFEAANKLLLSPGTSQIYYGDEIARPLIIKGADGDATLRSFMDWTTIDTNEDTIAILAHWQKLGNFRKEHPAIGAGVHQMISETPYVFSRTFIKNDFQDKVIVGLDLKKGEKKLDVKTIFDENDILIDHYSNQIGTVINGKLVLSTPHSTVLLSKQNK